MRQLELELAAESARLRAKVGRHINYARKHLKLTCLWRGSFVPLQTDELHAVLEEQNKRAAGTISKLCVTLSLS